MKNNRRTDGAYGESIAVSFLTVHGFKLLERNFHGGRRGEIDLIGYDGEYLVFAEVKKRKNVAAGYPEEAVTETKQKTIRSIAAYYMYIKRIPPDTPVRFDVVSVLMTDERKCLVRWLKNAF